MRSALVVAPTLPAHDREGGSRDLADMVRFLVAERWDVTYLAITAQTSPRYVRELASMGVRVHIASDGIPESLLAAPSPDVVVIAFWHLAEQLLPALRRNWPSAAVVISSIDLHFLRQSRHIFTGVARGERSFLLDGFFGDSMIREINTYAAADGVLAVSRKEALLINDLTSRPELASWVPVTHGGERSSVPFVRRSGILFVGNFRHQPNVEAVEHLCTEIVPHLSPDLLEGHPILIVGNAPDDRVKRAVERTPAARLVGWVPSLTPYLNAARVCVVPILHGAGVKGKVVRALAAGTPVVTTSVGVDGLDLEPGRDVMVADDPCAFAAAVEAVASDAIAWEALSQSGHEQIVAVHGDDSVRARLIAAITRALSRPRGSAEIAQRLEDDRPMTRYGELARKLRSLAPRHFDADVRVLVVSKGDEDLLDLGGLRAEHFPQDETGAHLGWHPADGPDVIARLRAQQELGRHYLVLPITSNWWLHHYAGVAAHLEETYRVALQEDGAFTAWEYVPPCATATHAAAPRRLLAPVPESKRPRVIAPAPVARRGRVLVLGVYLATEETHADDVIRVIGKSEHHNVTQRWVSLGGPPPSREIAAVTARVIMERQPKFSILNDLIGEVDIESFDHLLLVDDDIALPLGFVDHMLGWQQHLEFALAQPARTRTSYIDHRIVQQQPGSLSRRTRFVEIGPVVSMTRSAFRVLLPFDATSPMG